MIFTGNYNLDMSVLANYKALMGDIFNEILAFGWVQTADTGQTDPGSVGVVPAGSGNYAVFKTNDGLPDVFLRLAFMQGPTLQVQIGTGSDGAGNLTGNVTLATAQPSANSSGLHDVYLSGDAGRLFIAINTENNGGHNLFLTVERSHDGTGADTGDFATLIYYGWGSGTGQHSITFAGASSVLQSRVVAPLPSSASWQLGGNTIVIPGVPFVPLGNAQPMKDVLIYAATTDYTPNTLATIPIFGANHQYVVTAADNGLGSHLLMGRYE